MIMKVRYFKRKIKFSFQNIGRVVKSPNFLADLKSNKLLLPRAAPRGGGGGGGAGSNLFPPFFYFACQIRGQSCTLIIPYPIIINFATTFFRLE